MTNKKLDPVLIRTQQSSMWEGEGKQTSSTLYMLLPAISIVRRMGTVVTKDCKIPSQNFSIWDRFSKPRLLKGTQFLENPGAYSLETCWQRQKDQIMKCVFQGFWKFWPDLGPHVLTNFLDAAGSSWRRSSMLMKLEDNVWRWKWLYMCFNVFLYLS